MLAEVPDSVQWQVGIARRSAKRIDGKLATSRAAFRGVSHALLRAAVEARGPQTADSLFHFYCPMVAGGGGDWLQNNELVANPYRGTEMLRCGELVGDLTNNKAVTADLPSSTNME